MGVMDMQLICICSMHVSVACMCLWHACDADVLGIASCLVLHVQYLPAFGLLRLPG